MVSSSLGETIEREHAFEIFNPQSNNKKSSIIKIDFFLPNGCSRLGYMPNTIIETKGQLTSGTVAMAEQLLGRIRRSKTDISELLIYYVGEDDKAYGIKNERLDYRSPLVEGVRVIDFNQLLSLYTNSDIQPPKRDREWKKRSARNLEKASAFFSQGRNTLFIGAGVSCSAKLPNWNELLNRIGNSLVARGKISISQLKDLPKDSFNSDLVLVRLLEAANDDDGEDVFMALVHEALYGFPFSRKSFLLQAIIQLIKTGKVEAVISYNYDDLLEEALLSEPVPVPVSAIDRKNRPAAGTFPILHVHGFLPQRTDPSYERNIVLSEKKYHELYMDAFNWANIEQLHALTQSTCFFIGLSLKDPSIRRLLDIAHQKGTKDAEHYAFLCRPEYSNPRLTERVLRDMGVNVIWYNDKTHADLPTLVRNLATM